MSTAKEKKTSINTFFFIFVVFSSFLYSSHCTRFALYDYLLYVGGIDNSCGHNEYYEWLKLARLLSLTRFNLNYYSINRIPVRFNLGLIFPYFLFFLLFFLLVSYRVFLCAVMIWSKRIDFDTLIVCHSFQQWYHGSRCANINLPLRHDGLKSSHYVHRSKRCVSRDSHFFFTRNKMTSFWPYLFFFVFIFRSFGVYMFNSF